MLNSIDSSQFTWDIWRADSIKALNIPCRYSEITSDKGISMLRKFTVGWCKGESLPCRPKINTIALMCFKDNKHFWFHLRANEFFKVFFEKEELK